MDIYLLYLNINNLIFNKIAYPKEFIIRINDIKKITENTDVPYLIF